MACLIKETTVRMKDQTGFTHALFPSWLCSSADRAVKQAGGGFESHVRHSIVQWSRLCSVHLYTATPLVLLLVNYFSSFPRVVALLGFVSRCCSLDQASQPSHNGVWLLHVYPVKKYYTLFLSSSYWIYSGLYRNAPQSWNRIATNLKMEYNSKIQMSTGVFGIKLHRHLKALLKKKKKVSHNVTLIQ